MRISRIRKLASMTLISLSVSLVIFSMTSDTDVNDDRQKIPGLHPVEIQISNTGSDSHRNPILDPIGSDSHRNPILDPIGSDSHRNPILDPIGSDSHRNPILDPIGSDSHRNPILDPIGSYSHRNPILDPIVRHSTQNALRFIENDGHEENIMKKINEEKVTKLPPEKVGGNNPSDERSGQSNNNYPQLDKLSEIGGFLVEKKTPEFFHNVSLPHFVDSRDPHGLGEGGVPVVKTKVKKGDEDLFQSGWEKNAFNQYLSDQISVHRSLSDGRTKACKRQALRYSKDLPDVSVVIIFHNEAWSTLLRSVHSILDRTPEHLLREIFLVDDLSTMDHLKAPLEKYFNAFPKVKIIRCDKRQGLTRARLLGFYASTAPVVVFLDSHIECFPHYVQPLIHRIQENPTAVVFPCIESIGDETLGTDAKSHKQYGIFNWKGLTFTWMVVPASVLAERKDDSTPIRSPTMPGGLFAISRKYFEKLGTYDPGLDFWGGENIELSFKAWMCGGSVELVTCSHIGHIFRKKNPITWTHDIGKKNSVRVAEVWMDEYKNYFYEALNFQLGDYGDVSERKALRQRLGCHSFQWYLQNVYPNQTLVSKVDYAGEIRSVATTKCVDSQGTNTPGTFSCHGQGGRQFWYLTDEGHLAFDFRLRMCRRGTGKRVSLTLLKECASGEKWEYETETKWFKHSPSDLCLTSGVTNNTLTLQKCSQSRWQQWTMTKRRTDMHFPPL